MIPIEPGVRVRLNALGSGVAEATVLSRVPIDYHGMSGMAHRVTLELPNGDRPEALQVGTERLRFLDPRYSLAT